MLDWFGSGVFGGLFGSTIVKLLRKFRLGTIFFAAACGSQLVIFLMLVRSGGWVFAWGRMVENALTPIGFLFPLGMGALCVLMMMICAPDMVGKSKRTKSGGEE